MCVHTVVSGAKWIISANFSRYTEKTGYQDLIYLPLCSAHSKCAQYRVTHQNNLTSTKQFVRESHGCLRSGPNRAGSARGIPARFIPFAIFHILPTRVKAHGEDVDA